MIYDVLRKKKSIYILNIVIIIEENVEICVYNVDVCVITSGFGIYFGINNVLEC